MGTSETQSFCNPSHRVRRELPPPIQIQSSDYSFIICLVLLRISTQIVKEQGALDLHSSWDLLGLPGAVAVEKVGIRLGLHPAVNGQIIHGVAAAVDIDFTQSLLWCGGGASTDGIMPNITAKASSMENNLCFTIYSSIK